MDEPRPISALRFSVPIAIENTATVTIGMAFSAIIGGISRSALAAVGTSNTLITFLTAALSMLTTGSIILVARYAGAREKQSTSAAIEQSLLLTVGISALVTVACVWLASPLLRLLLPSAEPAFFRETVAYFQVVMLSFPLLMLYNVQVGILRAVGNSRASMYVAILMNIVQLLCAWVFLSILKWDMLGAGLSYVICRLVGAVVITAVVLKGSDLYHVHLPNLRKPDFSMFRRIFRVGLPLTVESASIQGGYLLANSMAMGLGTDAASVYQITNTVNSFSAIPQGICSSVALTVVGQQIGARRFDQARRSERNIWLACLFSCTALGLIMALLGTKMTGLYTSDPQIARQSADMVWIMIGFCLTGASINTVDPALKAGGEQKTVMMISILGVWLIRLPLTWLLAYRLDMGIAGVYIANVISLFVRMAAGLIKRRSGSWIHETL